MAENSYRLFVLKDENEFQQLSGKCFLQNKNSTQAWIKYYRAWAVKRQRIINLEEYSLLEVNQILG